MKLSGKAGNGPVNKWLNLGGDPGHRLDTGIQGLFSGFVSIGRYKKWYQSTVPVLHDARCSAGPALAGIAIAMTPLRHRPMTDSGTDVATLGAVQLAYSAIS